MILVTGGAGYIGSIVTAELCERGYEVTVYDNLSQGHRSAVDSRAAFVLGDLSDRESVRKVFDDYRIDAIMHFAGRTLVAESVANPMLYLGDNVRNGIHLLEAALAAGVTRFVYSSTANLFDRPEHIPITEQETIIPGSPYGEGKYILERMLRWLDKTSSLRYAALRYFNACGAGATLGEDHRPETHLIPLALQVALGQRESVAIFGTDYPTPDGTCVRDYIHVLDLAEAHILALEALGGGSRTYNLGNGTGFSVREVIEAARRISGRPIPTFAAARRPGDPAILVASSDKIRRELRWTPRFPDLDSMLESAWRWHRDHPSGYPEDQP